MLGLLELSIQMSLPNLEKCCADEGAQGTAQNTP